VGRRDPRGGRADVEHEGGLLEAEGRGGVLQVGPEGVMPGEGEVLVEGAGIIARGEEEAVVAEDQGPAGARRLGLRVRDGDSGAGVADVGEGGGAEEVPVAEELGGGRLLLRDGEHRRRWPRHDWARNNGLD